MDVTRNGTANVVVVVEIVVGATIDIAVVVGTKLLLLLKRNAMVDTSIFAFYFEWLKQKNELKNIGLKLYSQHGYCLIKRLKPIKRKLDCEHREYLLIISNYSFMMQLNFKFFFFIIDDPIHATMMKDVPIVN